MGRGGGQWEGEDGEGATGRGRRGSGQRGGEKKGKRRGDFTEGYDEEPGWNEVTVFLTLFTRATPGTPASLY